MKSLIFAPLLIVMCVFQNSDCSWKVVIQDNVSTPLTVSLEKKEDVQRLLQLISKSHTIKSVQEPESQRSQTPPPVYSPAQSPKSWIKNSSAAGALNSTAEPEKLRLLPKYNGTCFHCFG